MCILRAYFSNILDNLEMFRLKKRKLKCNNLREKKTVEKSLYEREKEKSCIEFLPKIAKHWDKFRPEQYRH